MLSVPEYSQTWLKKPIRVYGRNNWEWIVKFSCLFSHEIPGELFIVQSGNYCNDLKTTGRVTGGYICVSGYSSNPWTNAVRKKCDIILWLGSVWGWERGVLRWSKVYYPTKQGATSGEHRCAHLCVGKQGACPEVGSLPLTLEYIFVFCADVFPEAPNAACMHD